MTAIEHTGEHSGNDATDDLPLLTEVADDSLDSIPLLTEVIAKPVNQRQSDIFDLQDTAVETTEIVAESPSIPETDISSPHPFDDGEIQQLLHQLETHIETALREKLSRDTILTEKLSLQLEQLQQMAITQAIDEIKAELPELLRDALNARTKL